MSAATAASPKAASATTSLFLEPVAHPIERFDHVKRIYGLLEFLSQSLDMTVDCTIIYINLIIVGGIHQGVAAFDHAGTRGERLQNHELWDAHPDGPILPGPGGAFPIHAAPPPPHPRAPIPPLLS